jgi:hypothetical protein
MWFVVWYGIVPCRTILYGTYSMSRKREAIAGEHMFFVFRMRNANNIGSFSFQVRLLTPGHLFLFSVFSMVLGFHINFSRHYDFLY